MSSRRILLVDDSPTHRSLITVFLRGYGYEFVEAGTGLEGLQAVERGGIDLVIADINMPEMDGVSFVRRVRRSRDPAVRDVPIILLTAEKEATRMDEGRRAGANECLRKPVSNAGIAEAVARHFEE